MTVKLRPFQAKLKQDIYVARNEILSRPAASMSLVDILAVAATGSGKTVLFSDIMEENPGPSCAIAHRQELVSQISVALARNGVRHRIIGQPALMRNCTALHMMEFSRDYVNPNAKSAAAGVDTLIRLKGAEAWLNSVTLVVQDEAHHALRENNWGAARKMFPNAWGLHVTATPTRADGQGLGRHADGFIDAMVLAPSMRDLINMGYLTDYRVFAEKSNVDLSSVDISEATGDFNIAQVRKAVHASRVVGDVVEHYKQYAMGKLGVTFAVDVESAVEIAQAFRDAGVPAEVVSAKTPDTLRAHILRRFKNREILQLVNVDLFGEGFDLPAIEVVSFARPTASWALFCQQFGRTLRLMIDPTLLSKWDTYTDAERRYFISISGKPAGIIFDHVGNIERHLGPPDKRNEWTLDRRERRTKNDVNDAVPYRTCLNKNANGTGIPCAQPYPRVYKCCPYCKFYPEPANRSTPEFVDGNLIELDPSVLAAMRGEIDRVQGPAVVSPYGDPIIGMSIRKNHWERQQAHGRMLTAVSWWAGLMDAQGYRDREEQYSRFYYMFGTDIATAQTLNKADAETLTGRIASYVAKFGIDATVNNA